MLYVLSNPSIHLSVYKHFIKSAMQSNKAYIRMINAHITKNNKEKEIGEKMQLCGIVQRK